MKKHLFEAMERKLNFQHEYEKLERMVACEWYNGESVESWLEDHFRGWKYRGTYSDLAELRKQLGFDISRHHGNEIIFTARIGMNEYFLYCELLFTLFNQLHGFKSEYIDLQIRDICKTMSAGIEQTGFTLEIVENRFIIVEKNAVAIEVADTVPELSDVILEYNHYLLHGNLEKKKTILKKITDAIEPKRDMLKSICKRATDDYFELVNTMNIRHNNTDPLDKKKYNEQFACLSSSEQEEWYDLIYEQALTLFVLIEQQERNKKIEVYKHAKNNS